MVMLSLMLCGQALAGKQVFDSKVGKFSIDVPDKWSAQSVKEGCQITDDAGKNTITVQLIPSPQGLTPKDIAKKVAESMGMTVKKDTNEENATWLDGDIKGMPAGVLSAKNGPAMIVSIWVGHNREQMKKIFDSVKGASAEESFIELDAGPIWDNNHAKTRCPEVLTNWLNAHSGKSAEWTGEWRTVESGKNSVCRMRVRGN